MSTIKMFECIIIILLIPGAFVKGINDTVKIIIPPDWSDSESQFTISNEEIYYISNYAVAAMICLTSSEMNKSQPDIGIFELGVKELEPIVIKEIDFILGSYPFGHRVTFRDFQVNGLSNLTVNQIKSISSNDSYEFQIIFSVPKLSFTILSGVLILFPVIGGGEYLGESDCIEFTTNIKAAVVERNLQKFLRLDDLEVDFNIGDVKIEVKQTYERNDILESALNLFINVYTIDFLKEIKPHLKSKLTYIVKSFIDNWFNAVPIDNSYINCDFNDQ